MEYVFICFLNVSCRKIHKNKILNWTDTEYFGLDQDHKQENTIGTSLLLSRCTSVFKTEVD